MKTLGGFFLSINSKDRLFPCLVRLFFLTVLKVLSGSSISGNDMEYFSMLKLIFNSMTLMSFCIAGRDLERLVIATEGKIFGSHYSCISFSVVELWQLYTCWK